jgi:hypothetical protein
LSKTTPEERVAIKLTDLLSDLRLDLDLLGMYLAKIANTTFFLRSERVYQSAEESLKPKTKEQHLQSI